MQFRQVGKRIQVLAPVWDSEAKRTRQRMVCSLAADDPQPVTADAIRHLEGESAVFAVDEIKEWIKSRHLILMSERRANMSTIFSESADIYEKFWPSIDQKSNGWGLHIQLFNDMASVELTKSLNTEDLKISASINIDKGKNKSKVLVSINNKYVFESEEMKFIDAIDKCDEFFEAKEA